MTAQQVPLGRFAWYELMTSDPESATGFYAALIGWGTQHWRGGDMPYTMWTNNNVPVGGVMTLPEDAKRAGAPPHWLVYISAPDVDDTVAKAHQLGGTVLHGPQTVEGAGRFAILQDPQGAVFAVITPPEAGPDTDKTPERGEFSWNELATTDHVGAFDFYSALFGWIQTESMDMGPMGTYQMYGRSQRSLGGMYNKSAEMPGPPAWLYYIKVDDVDAAVDKVRDLGGAVLNGPMEVPGGDRVAQCTDPQGAVFALHAVPKSS